jgi:hypothetical protein
MDETVYASQQDNWDAGFEGGRYLVVSRLGPLLRVYPRPPEFRKHFWHQVYELTIRDWSIPLSALDLDQLCVVEAALQIRYQPSPRYAREHLEFIAELNSQLETSLRPLLKDLAEQELRRLIDDSAWLQDGCEQIEKNVADLVNEMLVLRGIHCRTRCRVEPRFAAVESIDLNALPPWPRHQAVYEDFLRRRRENKERLLKEQTEEEAAARRLLMKRDATLLEITREEETQRLARIEQEMESLQAKLAHEEARLKEQLDSETRKREEELEHLALLREKQSIEEGMAREAELAKHRAELAAETTRLAEQLEQETWQEQERMRHAAELRQQRAEAELQAAAADLEAQRAELASEATQQAELQTHELRQREEQLIQQGWLRRMQAEAEIKAKEAELETQTLAEENRLKKQRDYEARQREETLRHEAHLRQMQAAAELQAKELELERLRAEMAKVEAQLERQREYEARQHQEQLRHNAELRQFQTEQELKEKQIRAPEIAELEEFLNREIGMLAMERQRLRLEEEIRETKLSRTRNFLGKTRRRTVSEQEDNASEGEN